MRRNYYWGSTLHILHLPNDLKLTKGLGEVILQVLLLFDERANEQLKGRPSFIYFYTLEGQGTHESLVITTSPTKPVSETEPTKIDRSSHQLYCPIQFFFPSHAEPC